MSIIVTTVAEDVQAEDARARVFESTATLEVRRRADDFHVQVEGHPELWACGKSVDEALGNWLRTHQRRLKVEVVYK